MCAAPSCFRDRSGVLEEPISSLTPGKIFSPVRKAARKTLLSNSLDSRVEWLKTSQSDVVGSCGSSAFEAALELGIPPWSKSDHSDSFRLGRTCSSAKPNQASCVLFFCEILSVEMCVVVREPWLWSQQAWIRKCAPLLFGTWPWEELLPLRECQSLFCKAKAVTAPVQECQEYHVRRLVWSAWHVITL